MNILSFRIIAFLSILSLSFDAYGDAASEWKTLQQSLQEKLNAVENPKQLFPIFETLQSFSKKHSGTDEASLALCNLSELMQSIGKMDVAVSILRGAKTHAQSADLQASIQAQITKLSLREGGLPPQFSAKTVSGKDVSLAAYKGKTLLLVVWATWCGPCRKETPYLKKVYGQYSRDKFDILGISLDERKSALTKYLNENSMPWEQVYNKDRKPEEGLGLLYNTTNIPLMILIDRDGKIIKPGLRGEDLQEAVAEALNSTKG